MTSSGNREREYWQWAIYLPPIPGDGWSVAKLRWLPRCAGKITMEEALCRSQLTEEEFLSWQRAFETHGLPGLRATRIQQYREPRRPRGPRSRR